MTELTNMEPTTEHSLAYELLVELKHSAKRWFIAFCVMVCLEIGTIFGFMWYISLPVEELEEYDYDQKMDNIKDSNIKQVIGDYNGESETDSP